MVINLVLAGLAVWAMGMFLWATLTDDCSDDKLRQINALYKQYETAPSIDAKWHDMSLVGLCGYCGMDDSPIVIGDPDFDTHNAKCKWCAELDNLNYHLKFNGIRRWKKGVE